MKHLFLIAALVLLSFTAQAFDTSVLQIGLWPSNFQIIPEEIDIAGLKLNVPFSRNDKVSGIDIGLASSTKVAHAIQINAIINRNHEEFGGLQVGLINQNGNANGILVGIWNVTDDKTHGLQIGLINGTTEYRGVQIGLVNYTEMMCGIQIGLINIITESKLPFFPLVNFCF